VGMMSTYLESGIAKPDAEGNEMRFRFRSMVRLLTVAQGISTATERQHLGIKEELHLSYRGVLKSSSGFL